MANGGTEQVPEEISITLTLKHLHQPRTMEHKDHNLVDAMVPPVSELQPVPMVENLTPCNIWFYQCWGWASHLLAHPCKLIRRDNKHRNE